jgi:SAM-dependent methyltransferase
MIFSKKRKSNIDTNVFDAMGKYWAEIADQNSTDSQLKFIENTLKPKGFVLDLACGSGRHSIPLSKKGHSMVGLDVSSNLLKIANNRDDGVQLIKADMRFLPFKSETFSAALSMDTSLGYLPTQQDDLQSLSSIREALISSGVLIVDVFNRERLIKKHKANWLRQFKWALLPFLMRPNRFAAWMSFHFFKWREYPSFFLLQKRSIDAKGARLHDLWVICDKEDGRIRVFEHNVRLYNFLQLKGVLEKAGFIINGVYGGYDGQEFSSSSSRLILIGKVA